jgi:DNA-binding response OmpR family regulator
MNGNIVSQSGEVATAPVQEEKKIPQRILVVDDDGDMRRLNTEVLVSYGYEVDGAEDGAVAWDALQLNDYDLIVTDNRMPKVTGVELLKKMRAARMALPVIMATGVLPLDEFARYPWLKPAATLVSPYSTGELLGKVKEVLGAEENTFAPRPISRSESST